MKTEHKFNIVATLLAVSMGSPLAYAEVTVEEARLIARLYSAAFDRHPKEGGLNFWINSYESGESISSIASQFSGSPEFNEKYGPLDDRQFVEQLFRNVLGRNGAERGIQFWLGNLEDGMSRGYILSQFAGSPENIDKTKEAFSGIFLEQDGSWRFEYEPEPPPSPEGLWFGHTSSNREVQGLFLDDGSFYFLYSQIGDGSSIAGMVVGDSSLSEKGFHSIYSKDMSLEGLGIRPVQVNGSVAQGQLKGSVTYTDGERVFFDTAYSHDYDLIPSLYEVSGDYAGSVAFSRGFERVSFVVGSDGSISGEGQSGCEFGGYIYPRASGNVFNLSIEFEGFPCFFANQNFEGIAFYNTEAEAIYIVAPNELRTDGVFYGGAKTPHVPEPSSDPDPPNEPGLNPDPDPAPSPDPEQQPDPDPVLYGRVVVDALGRDIGVEREGQDGLLDVIIPGVPGLFELPIDTHLEVAGSTAKVLYGSPYCGDGMGVFVQAQGRIYQGADGKFYVASPGHGAVLADVASNASFSGAMLMCSEGGGGYPSYYYPAEEVPIEIAFPVRVEVRSEPELEVTPTIEHIFIDTGDPVVVDANGRPIGTVTKNFGGLMKIRIDFNGLPEPYYMLSGSGGSTYKGMALYTAYHCSAVGNIYVSDNEWYPEQVRLAVYAGADGAFYIADPTSDYRNIKFHSVFNAYHASSGSEGCQVEDGEILAFPAVKTDFRPAFPLQIVD